jgi:hypothetical protein
MLKNEVINRVIVESSEGDRAFLLLEGDIFVEKADVYIFNTYKNDSGMLLKKLKEQFVEEEIPETPFYFSPDGTEVGRIKLKNGRTILMLHPDLADGELIQVDRYQSIMHTVFASLHALENFGEDFETVAFPVLLRNCLANIYPDAVRILIEKSTAWLKESDNPRSIKYVLYENGDAAIWNDNLNKVLDRRVVHIDEFSDLRHYKNKALSILQLIDKRFPSWEDTLLPIQNALQRKDFRPEVVAAFSRKLLEVYCFEKLKEDTALHDRSLDGCLKYMRENTVLSEWDIQTLYLVRSFGNPSIHRPDPVVGPIKMGEKDVTVLLLCLCKLLELLYKQISEQYLFTFHES